MLDAMLINSRVENESMRQALHDCLVRGYSITEAAERNGYTKQFLSRRVKGFLEKKPGYDQYAAAALAAAPESDVD
ncbi:hypothetical protein [Burkholderia glumae]|nr:hypothetical protein [Burkholderia glumae]